MKCKHCKAEVELLVYLPAIIPFTVEEALLPIADFKELALLRFQEQFLDFKVPVGAELGGLLCPICSALVHSIVAGELSVRGMREVMKNMLQYHKKGLQEKAYHKYIRGGKNERSKYNVSMPKEKMFLQDELAVR